MAAPKNRPVRSANNRASKKRLSNRTQDDLRDHNATTARFFKNKNHRYSRRQGNRRDREIVREFNRRD